MKKFTAIFSIFTLITLVWVSQAFAAAAVKPKIQVEMAAADATHTTITVKVKEPVDLYSYKYNYSVDGGATWAVAAGPDSMTEAGTTGLFSSSFTANNYTNYLIRVTATHAGDTDSTAYTMSYPPNPSGHSNYSTNTNVCKNCHTTHTALGAKLLAQTNIENLCTSCHGSTANGAKYLVVAGKQVVSVVGATYNKEDSLGGGFPTGATASSHSYKELDAAATPPGGKTGTTIKMSCVKCHQGHAANDSDTYNYRLLKTTVTENTYTYDTTVKGIFPITDSLKLGADSYKTLNTATAWTPVAFGMSNFCGSCHHDFNVTHDATNDPANTALASNQSGKAMFNSTYYRHPVDIDLSSLVSRGVNTSAVTLPLFSSKMNCLTCHKAHGATTVQDTLPTDILRLDNRAVCENCHQK